MHAMGRDDIVSSCVVDGSDRDSPRHERTMIYLGIECLWCQGVKWQHSMKGSMTRNGRNN
jgi:hypothetical protein